MVVEKRGAGDQEVAPFVWSLFGEFHTSGWREAGSVEKEPQLSGVDLDRERRTERVRVVPALNDVILEQGTVVKATSGLPEPLEGTGKRKA